MMTRTAEKTVQTFEVTREQVINAPIEVVFETLLAHLGPQHEVAPEMPLPMKLEARPGGRWYRDLGNDSGHLWGHVQVIRPPKLLEISGPLFMSFPAISHVQYRLTEEGGATHLRLTHGAIGQMPPEMQEEIDKGREPWSHTLAKVREAAERRRGGR